MEQTVMDVRPPDLATARAVGHVAQQLATDAAERRDPEFLSRAEAAILDKLSAGPASGETLTEHVKACGIPLARNGKELGSLYARLRRDGLIVDAGDCYRVHGHGTKGGTLYRLGSGG